MKSETILDKAQLRYLQLLLDAGCKVKFKTFFFGKEYVWMTDRQGRYFLEPLPVEPVLSVEGDPDWLVKERE